MTQRFENTRTRPAHIVIDGQHEAGRQLPQRCTGPGKRRAVREKAQRRQQIVKPAGHAIDIVVKLRFCASHMVRHPPEHLLFGFDGLPIVAAPQVTLAQNGARIIGQWYRALQIGWQGHFLKTIRPRISRCLFIHSFHHPLTPYGRYKTAWQSSSSKNNTNTIPARQLWRGQDSCKAMRLPQKK